MRIPLKMLNGWMQSTRRRLVDLALPPICCGCGMDLEHPRDDVFLCAGCRRDYEATHEAICARCAAPVPAVSIRPEGCPHCSDTPFHFERIASLGVYSGDIERHILRMKHPAGEMLALTVGRMLGRRIETLDWSPRPNLILPIPMHWLRRLTRGVNSTVLLAEGIAQHLKIPIAQDLASVVRMVDRQAALTPSRRRRNMRGVFRISSAYDLREAHVLMVDDVLTTGATANAIGFALKKAGAASVSIAVAARGIGVKGPPS